ncbi:cytochrome c maturation protein CcmE [Candidatus Parabeggiatoa sp. HSG14]|uniref:cytochrome c maturation protein CcmE n=1 Tax=Candidatus Parabeggiatoa sp. HSG14 TaxID=3055593 RepID=UPI0025A717BD|nr:cytochrome c maturation protein CcmE [Thiotrichales bacterium HSG14]
MTQTHKKRLGIVLLIVLGIGVTVGLALMAFSENMLYFFSPTQIVKGEAPTDRLIRVGGMVNEGSVQRASDSLQINFNVTDYEHTIPVQYTGILPDLFREGQGIVAIGEMQTDGTFLASEVLAKHDENYMPPEVADSLKTIHADKTPPNASLPKEEIN